MPLWEGITTRPFKRCGTGQGTAGEAAMEPDRPSQFRLTYHALPPGRRATRRHNWWIVTVALAIAMLPALAFLALLMWVLSSL